MHPSSLFRTLVLYTQEKKRAWLFTRFARPFLFYANKKPHETLFPKCVLLNRKLFTQIRVKCVRKLTNRWRRLLVVSITLYQVRQWIVILSECITSGDIKSYSNINKLCHMTHTHLHRSQWISIQLGNQFLSISINHALIVWWMCSCALNLWSH